jgi:hypothetical protein
MASVEDDFLMIKVVHERSLTNAACEALNSNSKLRFVTSKKSQEESGKTTGRGVREYKNRTGQFEVSLFFLSFLSFLLQSKTFSYKSKQCLSR